MAKQSAQIEKPETGRPADSGFLRSAPPPVWIIPPVAQYRTFELFDINDLHFYMIHGVPMAFVGEVAHG